VLLLDASVTFENVWPTPAVRWWGALSDRVRRVHPRALGSRAVASSIPVACGESDG
jgi:hypothetical protein